MPEQLRGFKPRVIALLIDFLFDYIENLLPRIHSLVTGKGVRFPQSFPQVWKTGINWRESRGRLAFPFRLFNH
jgi:hypothetical protein